MEILRSMIDKKHEMHQANKKMNKDKNEILNKLQIKNLFGIILYNL